MLEYSLKLSDTPIYWSSCVSLSDGGIILMATINERIAALNRHFWARGYYVDTVGRNKKQIQEYIRNQLQEDQIADQISIKEFVDPFTGSMNKKA